MPLLITPTEIPEVLIIEPKVFSDSRGYFYESFNEREFFSNTGISAKFVQDNHSLSSRGVLRGLHYQLEHTQGKLVRVVKGSVFDVAVDLRQSSKTFGQSIGIELSAENKRQLWVPPGFAHGFLVTSNTAEFLYKTTDYWHAASEHCLLWNDSVLKIDWPNLGCSPVLNAKDAEGDSWLTCPKFS
jgi:dTDP-4-dehydrorhamnose 3,5-epimerase